MVNSSLYDRAFKNNALKKGGAPFKTDNFFSLLQSKKEFLFYVFANLIAQLGLTYVVMEYGPASVSTPTEKGKTSSLKSGTFIMIVIAQFAVLLAMIFIPMPMYIKLALFSVFSGLTGYMLSYVKNETDPRIIRMAIISTMGIFATMVVVGGALLAFGIQLGFWFGMGLLCALLLLIIYQFVSMFLGTYAAAVKIISTASLFIFSLFMIYDTNTILQRNYEGDFITASMDYYLDIINVFLDMVNLNR